MKILEKIYPASTLENSDGLEGILMAIPSPLVSGDSYKTNTKSKFLHLGSSPTVEVSYHPMPILGKIYRNVQLLCLFKDRPEFFSITNRPSM